MSRVGGDFLVTLLGAATSLLTAAVLHLIERYCSFSLYTWMFWFIIPGGAILSGFVGATGYWAGARFLDHRPTARIQLYMALIAVSTFFVVHYLTYATMVVRGRPVPTLVSFPMFLHLGLTHSAMEFRLHGTRMGSTGVLGGWGYLFGALQMLGFAIGGVCVYAHILAQPYCEECTKFLRRKAVVERRAADLEALSPLMEGLTPLFQSGALQQALELHQRFGDGSRWKVRVRTRMILWHCVACSRHFLRLTVLKRRGSDWSADPSLTREGTTQHSLVP